MYAKFEKIPRINTQVIDRKWQARTDGRTDRRTDTEGYNIIPRHTLVAGYKKDKTLNDKRIGAKYFQNVVNFILSRPQDKSI